MSSCCPDVGRGDATRLMVRLGVEPEDKQDLRGVLGGAPALTEIALAMMAHVLIVAVFAPLTMRLYARER